MEIGEIPPAVVKKAALTPKAVLHQKYGSKAIYKVEEVKESVEKNVCPGLVIPPQTQCLFRCCLELPELSVISDTCTRKKDAEQSAAKLALEQLGIQLSANNPTEQERWDELVSRLSYIFTDEFLLSSHPLTSHLKAALQREGCLCGFVPASILAACDAKLFTLCKSINVKAELSPLLTTKLILKAATSLSSSICISEGSLFIQRRSANSPEILQAFIGGNLGSSSTESIKIEAILIPCLMEKPVETLTLNVSSKEYYLDAIAQKLEVRDCSQVIISRTIGKGSSELRIYFPAPEDPFWDSDSLLKLLSHVKETVTLESKFNIRASYFSGQNIYGDALLASIGYTWKSADLYHADVSQSTYYRMLIGRMPEGNYKLSREAILATELPSAFTTRSNWRGPFPRDLLCMFCHQHHLLEPVFSTKRIHTSEPLSQIAETCKKLKSSKSTDENEFRNGVANASNGESGGQCTFRCEVRILSKGQDVLLHYSAEYSYRKQNDAIQSAALKILTWFKKYFKELDMPIEKLSSSGRVHGIHIETEAFSKEFALCALVHNFQQKSVFRKCTLVGGLLCRDQSNAEQENGVIPFDIEGPDLGITPSTGSLTCISYIVSLVREGKCVGEPLEEKCEFEFEMGTDAVIHQLESCVTQMSVNQAAHFITEMPSEDLILAASGEAAKSLVLSSLEGCCLKYSIKLLRVTEPLEDRMEQELFSPPLSKQRVEYAVRHINESRASTLVDFGCGAGSLLISLLEHPTTLEKIVGLDISRKSLCRAAKVIEHMEEDQACLFGDIVLSSFCPQILIVSTPNYEYNSIFQGNTRPNRDEELESQSLPFKFRNHDHKFEWTREQFNSWASNLALKHNYSVEFGGVGGTAGVEPGFASQIAVFRRNMQYLAEKCEVKGDPSQHYEVIWEWSRSTL